MSKDNKEFTDYLHGRSSTKDIKILIEDLFKQGLSQLGFVFKLG